MRLSTFNKFNVTREATARYLKSVVILVNDISFSKFGAVT